MKALVNHTSIKIFSTFPLLLLHEADLLSLLPSHGRILSHLFPFPMTGWASQWAYHHCDSLVNWVILALASRCYVPLLHRMGCLWV